MYPLKIFLQHEETGGNDRPNFTARKADTRGTRRIVFPLEKGGFTEAAHPQTAGRFPAKNKAYEYAATQYS
ncbi:hypothetical protein [Mucilaginibacter antarcticus]|uniref:Uncharacterized protein n=1 Tax=Mucilaginibacter antarcticus TaxID=1855725 RepID=A0ABW5XUX6_9SPHI